MYIFSNFTLVMLQLSEDGLGEEPSEDDTLSSLMCGKGLVCYHCPYESTSPYEWMTQIYHMPYTPAQLKCLLGQSTLTSYEYMQWSYFNVFNSHVITQTKSSVMVIQ
jgi:hypothetical protein